MKAIVIIINKIFFISFLIFFLFGCDVANKFINKEETSEKDLAQSVLNNINQVPDEKEFIDTNSVKLSKKELKKLRKEQEKQEKLASGDTLNLIQKGWYTLFPKKVNRNLTYPLFYELKPRSILVLYPWNRSKYITAPQMFCTSVSKELGLRGYYVLPAIPLIAEFKKDSLFSSQYVKPEDIKRYKDEYGVDAVLFTTIYTVNKQWWSENVQMIAHYNLYSTTTGELLFSRKADFNYDSPIEPSYVRNKKESFIKDKKEQNIIGVCTRMQEKVFSDMPYGPYHKKYMKDTVEFSHKVEMRYKVDIRPS